MRRFGAFLVLLGLAFPAAAAAADCPRTTLGDLEDDVMCIVCGTPLALAEEAPQAQRQRAFIEGLIADCRSEAQIKDALVAEFGEEVLAEPEAEGFDLAAYIVPGLAILLAAGAIVVAMRRWRGRPGPPSAPDERPADATRLSEDLERYEL